MDANTDIIVKLVTAITASLLYAWRRAKKTKIDHASQYAPMSEEEWPTDDTWEAESEDGVDPISGQTSCLPIEARDQIVTIDDDRDESDGDASSIAPSTFSVDWTTVSVDWNVDEPSAAALGLAATGPQDDSQPQTTDHAHRDTSHQDSSQNVVSPAETFEDDWQEDEAPLLQDAPRSGTTYQQRNAVARQTVNRRGPHRRRRGRRGHCEEATQRRHGGTNRPQHVRHARVFYPNRQIHHQPEMRNENIGRFSAPIRARNGVPVNNARTARYGHSNFQTNFRSGTSDMNIKRIKTLYRDFKCLYPEHSLSDIITKYRTYTASLAGVQAQNLRQIMNPAFKTGTFYHCLYDSNHSFPTVTQYQKHHTQCRKAHLRRGIILPISICKYSVLHHYQTSEVRLHEKFCDHNPFVQFSKKFEERRCSTFLAECADLFPPPEIWRFNKNVNTLPLGLEYTSPSTNAEYLKFKYNIDKADMKFFQNPMGRKYFGSKYVVPRENVPYYHIMSSMY